MDRILNSEPWSFDKLLVDMQRNEGDKPLHEISFERTTLWVQVHGLPFKYMTLEAGIKIYEVIGKVTRPTET